MFLSRGLVMKRFISCFFLILFIYCCASQQDVVEKILEDGVEVVINHLEPYQLSGEPTSLKLEEELNIDFEDDEIAKIGLTGSPAGVDVDSIGDIYLFQFPKKEEDLVFKFDRNGNFVTSFGHRGQGPGEVNFAWHFRITNEDQVAITGPAERKLFVYENDGGFNKYIDFRDKVIEAFPLNNGNILVKKEVVSPESQFIEWPLSIYNPSLQELKELDRYQRLDVFRVDKIEFPEPVFIRSVSNGKIYVGNTRKGYEIWVYGVDGNLLRKIRKEYQPVPIPGEIKDKAKQGTKDKRNVNYGKQITIHKYWPPFRYLFTDDEGRLYVMTNEEAKNPGEFYYDVFNSDGVFFTRISLSNLVFFFHWDIQYVAAKNGRLYCLRKKDSGYSELVVSKMIWQ